MADKDSAERQTDGDWDEARRQFMERFGKLALVAAPAAAVLLTSMSTRAIACSGVGDGGDPHGQGGGCGR